MWQSLPSQWNAAIGLLANQIKTITPSSIIGHTTVIPPISLQNGRQRCPLIMIFFYYFFCQLGQVGAWTRLQKKTVLLDILKGPLIHNLWYVKHKLRYANSWNRGLDATGEMTRSEQLPHWKTLGSEQVKKKWNTLELNSTVLPAAELPKRLLVLR